MKTLKSLKWEIIIPHEDLTNTDMDPIHRNLVMWLRQSEFMYL